jgi:HK97 gp10 family phage protein
MSFHFEYDKQIFEKVRDVVNKCSLDAVKLATQMGASEARKNCPISNGDLRNSIVGEAFMDRQDKATGMIGTTKTYAPYVEFGTKAHFPPVESLYEWVRRKLAVKDYKSVAFLIARKISRTGTRPQPFLFPAVDKYTRKLGGYLKENIGKVKTIK